MQNHPKISFAIAIVDEAQTIADGPRGILLQSVLDEIVARNDSVQLFFAAPFVDNPDLFGSLFPRPIVSEVSTATAVGQNVIFVDSDPADRRRISFAHWNAGSRRQVATHVHPVEFGAGQDFVIQLASWLGSGTQNLLYALGPSECEQMALKLRELVTPAPESEAARQALSNFIKEAIHPRYVLAETVLKGVGFHYGDMPTLVRKTLEEHFDSGILNYLVSTSTLLHGVNLPARNLFLYKPFKGAKAPMQSVDFWNLAGRAGRLGREFAGNVFLIDYDEWQSKPLSGPRQQHLVSALTTHLTRDPNALVEYMRDRDRKPEPRKNIDEFEGTFVRLFTDYRQKKLEATLERAGLSPGSETAIKVNSALSEIASTITLSDEVD
jgi:hypothetical protein